MSSTGRLTVEDLLGLRALKGAALLGGAGGLSHTVEGFSLLSVVSDSHAMRPGRAVVVALPGQRPAFELDLVLRRAHEAGAVAVLMANVTQASISTGRLADALELPAIRFATADPLASTWELERMAHHPELAAYDLLQRGLGALPRADATPHQLTVQFRQRLGLRTSVVSTDAGLIAGEDLEIDPQLLARTVGGAWPRGDRWLVLWPVRLDGSALGSVPDLWFALDLGSSHSETVRAAERLAAAAALKLELWAVRQRLGSERDAQAQAEALAELLSSDTVAPAARERALRVGFRLDGWHTGLYVRVAGRPSARQQLRDLATLLADELATGPLVPLHGGWATWLSDRSDPETRLYRERTAAVRGLLERVSPDGGLIAGIGRPYEGVRGISESLQEARDAALFASFDTRRGSVQHIDELGSRRILSEWYRAEAFRSHALDLLAPLLSSGEPELARTLGAYLDHESSASATASHLGIHRNTVFDRVSRAERLLEVHLSSADDRLVLQMACRVLGLGSEDQDATSASSGT
jgi:purine catabolism regulator